MWELQTIDWLIDWLIWFDLIRFIDWLIDWFDLIDLFDLIWFDLIDLFDLIWLIWFDLIDYLIWLIDWLVWLDWNWIGLNWIGLDNIGMDRIGLDWIGLDDIIAYPYAWTVNLKIWSYAQLRTYQPPIPKPSQASAWPYMYIGHWVCKTEGSPTGFARISKGWMAEKIPRQKWSISYLWEHFLVPEHRIPISVILGGGVSHEGRTRAWPTMNSTRQLRITFAYRNFEKYFGRYFERYFGR